MSTTWFEFDPFTENVTHIHVVDNVSSDVMTTTQASEITGLDCSYYEFLFYGPFLLVVSGFGVIGNTLACVVLAEDSKKSATPFLLICLAVTDNLVLVTYVILLSTVVIAARPETAWTGFLQGYAWLQSYGWPASSVLQVAEGWLILLVTVHRYLAVCRPTLTSRWSSVRAARLQTLAVIIGSLIFNIPRFLEYTVGKKGDWYTRERTPLHLSEAFQIGYKAAAYYLFVFLIPMATLTVLTVRLLVALKRGNEKRQAMTQTRSHHQREDITSALVVVVAVFLVCQISNPLRRILKVALPASQQVCGTFYAYFSPLTGIAISFNSAVNFPIFCLFGKRFRQKTARKLCGWARPNLVDPNATRDGSGNRTGNTTAGNP